MKCTALVKALVGVCVLSSCTVLPEAKPIDFYVMTPMPVITTAPVVRSHIRVATPELGDALQFERIVRVANDGSIVAYPDAKWSSSIASMWQNWLLEGLWRDSRFEQISSAQQGFDSQWLLAGRLQAFHIEETAQGPMATVRFDAQLINAKHRRLHVSKSFVQQTPVASSTTSAAVQALQVASGDVGRQLLDWLAATP